MASQVTTTTPLPYRSFKREQNLAWIPTLNIQRALLAVTVVCAILSLIPTLGTIGAISCRSIALITGGIHCIEAWKNEGKWGLAVQSARVAFIALGLMGVITQLNILSVTSVAGDLLFQMAEAARGLHKKDLYKAFSHMGIILIDTFVLAAMLTGGWQYIVTATAVSTMMMIIFAVGAGIKAGTANDPAAIFEVVCYVALALLGIASSVRAAELSAQRATRYYFTFTNRSKTHVNVYSRYGELMGRVAPGQTIKFDLDPHATFWENGKVECRYDNVRQVSYYQGNGANYVKDIMQRPMNTQEFPTLPVGGSSIVVTDPRLAIPSTAPHKATNDMVQALRTSSPLPVVSCRRFNADVKGIVFKHQQTGKMSTFDFDAMCQQVGYFKHSNQWKRRAGQTEADQVTLDIDEKSFDLLMHFFVQGDLSELDQLAEQELIELYYTADYLQIPRLIDLCVKEAADRLAEAKWDNTALLKPFRNSGQALSKLVDLYVF